MGETPRPASAGSSGGGQRRLRASGPRVLPPLLPLPAPRAEPGPRQVPCAPDVPGCSQSRRCGSTSLPPPQPPQRPVSLPKPGPATSHSPRGVRCARGQSRPPSSHALEVSASNGGAGGAVETPLGSWPQLGVMNPVLPAQLIPIRLAWPFGLVGETYHCETDKGKRNNEQAGVPCGATSSKSLVFDSELLAWPEVPWLL